MKKEAEFEFIYTVNVVLVRQFCFGFFAFVILFGSLIQVWSPVFSKESKEFKINASKDRCTYCKSTSDHRFDINYKKSKTTFTFLALTQNM